MTNPCSQLSQQPMQTKLHLSTASRYTDTNTNATSEHVHRSPSAELWSASMTSVHCPGSCWMSGSGVRATRPGTDPAHRQPGSWVYKCCLLCSVISFPCSGLGSYVTSAVSSLVVVPGLATHWGSLSSVVSYDIALTTAHCTAALRCVSPT